jgi:hypothetical protein
MVAVTQQTNPDDPRFTAALDLLPRTGAREVQIRYSDDEQPVVWIAVALYDEGRWESASGHDPVVAAFRLLAQLYDGGRCTHCNKPTGFSEDVDALPFDASICWTQWDPELKKFRRGCAGDTVRPR